MKHIDFKHIILAAILAIACMPATRKENRASTGY